MTALADARARVAELETFQANLKAEVDAALAARTPVQKKRDALLVRLHRLPLIGHLGGQFHLTDWASITPGDYALRAWAGKKRKDIVEGLTSGNISVSSGSYGQSYKAKGIHPRLRAPNAERVKAWQRAVKASDRADQRAKEAQKAEDEALKAVFDTGTKIEPETLINVVADRAMLQLALDAIAYPYDKERQLAHLTDADYGELTIARRHLRHLTKKSDDPTCPTCVDLARTAEQLAARVATITALPRRKFTCPTHGKVIGYSGRSNREQVIGDGDERRRLVNAPLLYCPRDWAGYIDSRMLAEDDAKAARAAARAKTSKAKSVTFICPDPECEQVSTVEVQHSGNGDYVECPVCESQWGVNAVRQVKPAKEDTEAA